MTLPDPDEDALHEQIARYLNVSLFKGALWWHTPNQGKRSPATGAKFKRMGMKAGVGDISILTPPHGFYFEIEVKTRTGKRTPAQIEREALVIAAGGQYAVCRSVDQVHAQLMAWNVNVKARM